MAFSLSPPLVKKSLSSHSWVGLLVGALMYLVCLSGTLAVFYQEFHRWEQPGVEEYSAISSEKLQQAFETMLASGIQVTDHLYVTLPTQAVPRSTVQTENIGWFVNGDGSLGQIISRDWTDLLTDLHLYLHLPKSWGMIVVSILGVMLCSLIISGFLAHPRIFRDAFTLRLKGSRHLEQADIHNRLSVWGAPFHLMIAITGAYFGLAALLTLVMASAFFDGDRGAVMDKIFGVDPELNHRVETPDIRAALDDLAQRNPDVTPFFVTVHEAGSPKQFIDVGARVAGRMSWAEWYQYDTQGNYLSYGGYTDGSIGKQAVYSVYRLHFGHFGGVWVKIAYAIFGLALTVVSVTGINIWLARRKTRDAINNLWIGFVWGTPPALVASAIFQIILGVPAIAVLWGGVGAAMAMAQWRKHDAGSTCVLQLLTALLLVVFVLAYAAVFRQDFTAPMALAVNGVLLAIAAVFAYLARRTGKAATALAASGEKADFWAAEQS